MNTFSNDQASDIKIISHSGRLDTNTSGDFDLLLQPLLEKEQFVIIDLSQCPYLSSSGIRILVKSTKKLNSKQGALYLTGLVPGVKEVIEMAGLNRVFHIEETIDTAHKAIRKSLTSWFEIPEWTIGNQNYLFTPSQSELKPVLIWNHHGIAGYNELGFSIGFGTPAESGIDEKLQNGLFVTTGHCAGFVPDNPVTEAEFRISSEPEKSGVLVSGALSFGLQHQGCIQMKGIEKVPIQNLAESIEYLKNLLQGKTNGMILLVMIDQEPSEPTISVAILNNKDLYEKENFLGIKELQLFAKSDLNKVGFTGISFCLSELNTGYLNKDLHQFLNDNLTIENILEVSTINNDQILQNPVMWLFYSNETADAESKRLTIETDAELVFEPYKAFLMRRLYTDSARVKVEELHGGFSAQTYQVTSFDSEGRKMRPTVLKVANRALIMRESERCRQYALPYIFNNSAIVLGAEFYGETGALRYNFVGIGGEKSQLKWLAHYYHHAEMELVESLFDKVFLEILKPWHGQPVRKTIFPFKDHDPTLTFFPHIEEAAQEVFSVSSDEQFIQPDGYLRPLLNPYWFLKHHFPSCREHSIDYFIGICHGDLNMQNILLDENMNIYLIDFSETKPRSVISDYARLEAILLVDNAPVETENDISDYIEFISKFYAGASLDEIPVITYNGRHNDKVSRNAALSLKLRKYALDSVGGNPDIVPYLLALLEWLLPVVCWSIPFPQKKVSMILAGLISEQILKSKIC